MQRDSIFLKIPLKHWQKHYDQKYIWVIEDEYTNNLGTEIKNWIGNDKGEVVMPMRTKRESLDWLRHLTDLKDEMVAEDVIVWAAGRMDLAKEQDDRAWRAVELLMGRLPEGVRFVFLGLNERKDFQNEWLGGKVNRRIDGINSRIIRILMNKPLDTLFVRFQGLTFGDY